MKNHRYLQELICEMKHFRRHFPSRHRAEQTYQLWTRAQEGMMMQKLTLLLMLKTKLTYQEVVSYCIHCDFHADSDN